MKILSVKDSKRFFKHLAECTGLWKRLMKMEII